MDQASKLRKLINKRAGQMKKDAKQHPEEGNGPRVIAVTSGKGGVGKTNIVGNLALAFRDMGKRVLIFDADLGLANIDIIFGVHPEFNIGHVVTGEKELKDVIVETETGIAIIPALSGDDDMTELTEAQKLTLLSEFETIESVYDVVLIDTAAGISSNVIYFNLAAEECIVVVTGEPTSITDAYGIIKILFGKGAKRFKLLVNMVGDSGEARSVYGTLSQAADRFLKGVVTEYIGYIPYDKCVKASVIARKPVFLNYPKSDAATHIRELARKLATSSRQTDHDGNIKFFMQRLLNIN